MALKMIWKTSDGFATPEPIEVKIHTVQAIAPQGYCGVQVHGVHPETGSLVGLRCLEMGPAEFSGFTGKTFKQANESGEMVAVEPIKIEGAANPLQWLYMWLKLEPRGGIDFSKAEDI